MIDSVVMTPLSEPIHIHSLPSSTCQPFFILIQIIPGVLFLNILLRRNQSEEEKTQCQPCKRLAGSIIPLSWSGLEKGVTLDVIIRGESTTIFLGSMLLVGYFGIVTNNHPNEQLDDPKASLKEGSLLQFILFF